MDLRGALGEGSFSRAMLSVEGCEKALEGCAKAREGFAKMLEGCDKALEVD